MVVRQRSGQLLVRHGVRGILGLDHDPEPLLITKDSIEQILQVCDLPQHG